MQNHVQCSAQLYVYDGTLYCCVLCRWALPDGQDHCMQSKQLFNFLFFIYCSCSSRLHVFVILLFSSLPTLSHLMYIDLINNDDIQTLVLLLDFVGKSKSTQGSCVIFYNTLENFTLQSTVITRNHFATAHPSNNEYFPPQFPC